jgi:ABC-2 type transport system ATP-binding protein
VADYPDISKINLFEENHLLFEVEFLNEAEISGIENIMSVTPKGNNVYVVLASTDVRPQLFDFAVKTGNKIQMIKPVERSMEEVFRSLTR